MLKKPAKLEKLVRMVASETDMPFTVKIRLGISDESINVHKVVEMMKDAGAAAVTIHGRTKEQRYTRPANWHIVNEVADRFRGFPIIGNGDVLTWYEVVDRLHPEQWHADYQHRDPSSTTATAWMAARGALIKPWIFKEYTDRKYLASVYMFIRILHVFSLRS
jgi:tRNA-dihydrouridine synthase 3